MTPGRKIVQIAFETEGDINTGTYNGITSGTICSTLWALCDDGTLWALKPAGRDHEWRFVDRPIPQDSIDSLREKKAATVPE